MSSPPLFLLWVGTRGYTLGTLGFTVGFPCFKAKLYIADIACSNVAYLALISIVSVNFNHFFGLQ